MNNLDAYGEQLDKMEKMVKDALPVGEQAYVCYSAYKTSKATDNPLNNLKQVAIRGKVIMQQNHDEFWGGGSKYTSEVMENPTWLDISVAANKMIPTTGDYHHSFLEAVYPAKKKIEGVKVYNFSMGS